LPPGFFLPSVRRVDSWIFYHTVLKFMRMKFRPSIPPSASWLSKESAGFARTREVAVLTLCLCLVATGAKPAGERRNSDALVSSAIVNPKAPYPECHASTIVEVSPGKLAAAWFGGTKEGNRDVGIWFAEMEDGKWLPAVEVADGLQPDGKRYPTWNPVLFKPENEPLVLFYKAGPSPSTWWGMMMTSSDGGRNWSKPRRLPDGVLGPVKDKPVLLSDGSWLCGSSEEGGGWKVHFELTSDEGRTWKIIGPVDGGGEYHAIQPTILFHRDGRLQALCRTQEGVIAATWSSDGGKSWSALTSTGLPNPNSGIDAVTLSDGRQLLVYNDSKIVAGKPIESLRCPLNVAISNDGVKWKNVLTLEDRPLPAGYAYPAVIQSSDGLVRITYTWNREHIKYVAIDPGKL
jgi:predicted neuraminidase